MAGYSPAEYVQTDEDILLGGRPYKLHQLHPRFRSEEERVQTEKRIANDIYRIFAESFG